MLFNALKAVGKNKLHKKLPGGCDSQDFTAAVADFSLAHTELMAFRAALKIQEVVNKASELAAASQEMAATTQEVSASTQEINAGMHEVKTDAMENINQIDNLEELTAEVKTTLGAMTGNTGKLAGRIKNIDAISQNVSEIADQTNLLSLNAAIEAARAGEHGRGFSVVAEEVRKLAGQTKSAVSEVKEISNYINNEAILVGQAVSGVEEVFEKYISGVGDVSGKIRHSVARIEESTEASDNIANAMQQQAAVTDSLARLAQDLTESANFVDLLTSDANYLAKTVSGHIKLTGSDLPVSILAARLVDHANFLRQAIAGAGKNIALPDHHQCAFGKWYDANYDRYKHLQEYTAVDEPHAQVHAAALALARECNVSNAEAVLAASMQILDAFIKLLLVFEKEAAATG